MLFLKFSSNREHLEYLQKGNFYMKSGEYYIEREKILGEKGIGDLQEFLNKQYNKKAKIIFNDENRTTFDLELPKLEMRPDFYINKPLFCMTILDNEDFKVIKKTKNYIECLIDEVKVNKEKLKSEFGKFVLLTNGEFLKELENECNRQKIEINYNKIMYTDNSINSVERDKAFYSKSSDFFFFKDKSFSHQKEFRIVLENKLINSDEDFQLKIKKFKSKSTIMTVDELFSEKVKITFNKY